MAKNSRSSYGVLGATPIVALYPVPIISTRSPLTSDLNYELGSVWINTSTNQAWTLTSVVSGSATWALSSPGASDVDTINSLSPVAGDILIDGGTNITDVNAGNTVTLNLDDAITLATSVTSPLYTAAAGADLALTAPAGQDVIIKMGDNAAANKVSFVDSGDAEVFAIDSNGGIGSLTALTVAGAFTQTAGAVNIGQDNAANAINIGGGTTARAIGIGNSAAAHTITIGSSTGAASLDLVAGTGNFTLEGDVATTYTISGSGVNTGLITIGGGTGAQTINLMNSTGVKTVNIANGVSGNTVSVLNGANTVAQTLNLASGANAADSTVNILGGVATAGTQTLNLATGASASVVNIGNATGATSVTITSGTGSIALASTGTGNITVDSDNTLLLDADGVLELNSSAGIISIGNDADAFNINIGTGAAARVITLGNVTGATQLVLNSGTGGIQLGSTGAGDITLNSSDDLLIDSAGVLELNSSGGVIGIGNDAVAQNINIGTGAAARTVTIGNTTGASSVVVDVGTGAANFGTSATAHTTTVGSTTGASALVLQSGTGRTTMTGTVKQVDADLMGQTGVYIPSFTQDSIAATAANTGGVPTGATGDVNVISLQTGAVMQGFVVGAGQTILQPIMGANGLIISADQTNTEGMEYNFPYLQYTIGTSAAFAFELSLYINDMDGAAPYVFGFRKTEANNATWGNYTDYATIGMIAASSPTNIVTATELNSGGQTVTDTTDAWGGDGSYHILRVLVDGSGNVTYTIDGSAPSSSAAFQFDNADVVIPFIRIGHSGTPTDVAIKRMRIGFQA